MTVLNEIRSLTHDDVVMLAREQAERGEPMAHYFDVGTTEACTFERAYVERQRQLEEPEG